MSELKDFMSEDLLLLYDEGWKIAEVLLRRKDEMKIKNRAVVDSVKYADGTELEGKHYFLKLDTIIYLTENEAVLWGRVRKYDPKTNVVSGSEREVVMNLRKVLEDEKIQDLLYVGVDSE
jgi:small nuclear ribonucleoprotein (snRNP)-like protein